MLDIACAEEFPASQLSMYIPPMPVMSTTVLGTRKHLGRDLFLHRPDRMLIKLQSFVFGLSVIGMGNGYGDTIQCSLLGLKVY